MLDFNDAAPQMGPMGEVIPDGTFAKIMMTIRPGGVNGPGPTDAGLLKASNSANSDVKMLDCEFVVVSGPFDRRKFWQNFTVAGGKLDKNGASMAWNISKSTFRAMIESALGLDPKDLSPETRQKRTLQGLAQLSGITFAGRIMVEPGNGQYADKNTLANVVLRGDPNYDAIMRGEPCEPDPVNAKPKKPNAAAQAQPAPGWNTQGSGGAPAPQGQLGYGQIGYGQTGGQQTAPAQQPAQSAAPAPAWLAG